MKLYKQQGCHSICLVLFNHILHIAYSNFLEVKDILTHPLFIMHCGDELSCNVNGQVFSMNVCACLILYSGGYD